MCSALPRPSIWGRQRVCVWCVCVWVGGGGGVADRHEKEGAVV